MPRELERSRVAVRWRAFSPSPPSTIHPAFLGFRACCPPYYFSHPPLGARPLPVGWWPRSVANRRLMFVCASWYIERQSVRIGFGSSE
eukprot:2758939-Pyramimonas_sp.AAC.1